MRTTQNWSHAEVTNYYTKLESGTEEEHHKTEARHKVRTVPDKNNVGTTRS